jgi:chemotaxis response regulator CheB
LSSRETEHLRVLIANERKDRLALVAPIVAALGHEVIPREIEVEDVGAVTARERPDVALVGLGESSQHALHLVEKIVHEATCPVIALIHAPDPGFVKEASKRGSSPTSPTPTRRTGRARSTSCCAASPNTTTSKGRSAAVPSPSERRAFSWNATRSMSRRPSSWLREHARSTNRKLVDVASAVVDGHRLLPKRPNRRIRLTGRRET